MTKVSHLIHGLKPKDLLMMPARVAMALQADGSGGHEVTRRSSGTSRTPCPRDMPGPNRPARTRSCFC